MTENGFCYKAMSQANLQRNDQYGEFLNRPLFIMKSIALVGFWHFRLWLLNSWKEYSDKSIINSH